MLEPDELTLFALRFEVVGAPYMISGATAAILYGQPRVTNDRDVVLALDDAHLPAFSQAFPEADFYVPPEGVLREWIERRGLNGPWATVKPSRIS